MSRLSNTVNVISNPTSRFVLVAEGESNGPWDSDGFRTYFDFEDDKFVRDNWTTRFACNMPGRKFCRPKDLTAEERATLARAKVQFAFELLAAQSDRSLPCSEMYYNFKNGLHITIKGGHLFRGVGELVSIRTKSFRLSPWNSASYNVIKVRTADGRVERANAKYATIDIPEEVIEKAAEKYAQEIIEEDGFNSNGIRYSRRQSIVDFVLRLFAE